MFKPKYTLLFLFLFNCFLAKAAIFMVTSNADSGPGTLRQALLDAAANGIAMQDHISFNLTSNTEAARTITILTPLPVLTSKLYIDGRSQANAPFFGVSSTCIKLLVSYSAPGMYSCLNLNGSTDVELYGLLLDIAPLYRIDRRTAGVYLKNCKNITIGKPGSGNLIKNFSFNVYSDDNANGTTSENIFLRGNILGLEEDGISQQAGSLFGSVDFNYATNVQIGGNNVSERNWLCGLVKVVSKSGGKLLIQNNFLGLNLIGTAPVANASQLSGRPFYGAISIANNDQATTSDILDNVILGNVTVISSLFNIKGNKFGTNATNTQDIPFYANSALTLTFCDNGGLVGGPNPEDQNIFAALAPSTNSSVLKGVIINTSSPKVEVLNNLFRCNAYKPLHLEITDKKVPVITARTANSLSGKSIPYARIDLYYSLVCDKCEPQQRFASVHADAAGNWVYTGSLSNYGITAAATLDYTTYEFSSVEIIHQIGTVKITPACNGNNGSIKGLTSSGASQFKWYNSSNAEVGNTIDLENVPAGKYRLVATDNFCSATSQEYEIQNAVIGDAGKQTVNPSCNQNNGRVTALTGIAGAAYVWRDASNAVRSTMLDLINVPAGQYTLTATIPNVPCTPTYTVTLTNTTAFAIDQTTATVTPTPCGQSVGAVSNVSIVNNTGTLSYSWRNVFGVEVSTAQNLSNKPAGTYTLTVIDGSGCSQSATFTIQETSGITLNDNGQPTQPDCEGNLGKITGITATGATSYRWYNVITNQTVATTANASNLQPGTYRLEVSNGNGCSQTSTNYTINTPGNNEFYGIVSSQTTPATCGLNNGSITVVFTDPTAVRPKSVRWAKQGSNQNLGSAYTLGNLDAGNYDLYVTAQNGCEKLLGGTFVVDRIPGVSVDVTAANVKPDECGLNNGSITGINVSQATSPVYTWRNQAQQTVGNTLELLNKPAGTYTLTVKDGVCEQSAGAFTINATDTAVPTPVAPDLQLCSSGPATLIVYNPIPLYGYKLYNDATSPTPIATEASGKFQINISGARSYYVSQYRGSCESTRIEVRVSVGISNVNISNAISANGDGINDVWKINSIENYPNALVQIFNRNGQKVFESRGYTRAFDGTYLGQPLPAGTYYYVINLNTSCSLLTGSLTLLR